MVLSAYGHSFNASKEFPSAAHGNMHGLLIRIPPTEAILVYAAAHCIKSDTKLIAVTIVKPVHGVLHPETGAFVKMLVGFLVDIKQRMNIPEHISAGNDFVKAVFKNGNSRERWLFVATPDQPVTAFFLKTQGALPRAVWPRELPQLPAGARVNMVMEIPRVNAVYGAFDNLTSSGSDMLASYTARMASAGWFHAGAEHSPAIRNSGEVYFRNTPERQILWIKFSDNGNGAFYLKKFK